MSFWAILVVHAGLGVTIAIIDRFFSGEGARFKTTTWVVYRGHDRKLTAALVVELVTLIGACQAGQPQVASALVLLIPQAIVLVAGIDLAELAIKAFDRVIAARRRRRVEVLAPADRALLSEGGFEQALDAGKRSALDEKLGGH